MNRETESITISKKGGEEGEPRELNEYKVLQKKQREKNSQGESMPVSEMKERVKTK